MENTTQRAGTYLNAQEKTELQAIAGGLAQKQSPLVAATSSLAKEIAILEELVGILFDSLNPVLTPEVPRDEMGMASESQAPQSAHVEDVNRQAMRIVQVRHRLEYLKGRLEV